MTTASQGTSFVGKTVPNPLLKSKGIWFLKKIFSFDSACACFIFQVRVAHQMWQGPVKKDKNNNPLYICRWKNNEPLSFLASRNFLSTTSDGIFILKQQTA